MSVYDPSKWDDPAEALAQYNACMRNQGCEHLALQIEEHWGLAGLPPGMVCAALSNEVNIEDDQQSATGQSDIDIR